MYGVFYFTLWFVFGASLLGIIVAYLLAEPFGERFSSALPEAMRAS